MAALSSFWRDESGATAIEYGLIAALISVIIIAALRTIGTRLSGKFNAVGNQLTMLWPSATDYVSALAFC